MASSSLSVLLSSPLSHRPCVLRLSSFSPASISLRNSLRSSTSLFGFPLTATTALSPVRSPTRKSFTVTAAKGYKMKTHKASAKRFRVTGRGKIVRRRAGKQHLLQKKNTKRKLRLSKMVTVKRSDYDNIIGALPYLKVDRSEK